MTYIPVRNHTAVFFAKPAIPVSGDEIINSVANEFGDNAEYGQTRPYTSEMTGDYQRSIALIVKHSIIIHQNAVNIPETRKPYQDIAAGRPRQAGKPEQILAIPFNNELHSAIAQIAVAIKKHKNLVVPNFQRSVAFIATKLRFNKGFSNFDDK